MLVIYQPPTLESKTPHKTILQINHETFRCLYKKYWKKVFGVCYHLLQDVELAKELAQDIFESLWKRRESLCINDNAEAYLLRAAKLAVFEYIRNQHIRQKHLNQYTQDVPESGNSTLETVFYAELSKQLDELLDHLPDKRQQIYRLNFQGASHRDIAAMFEVSEKTVEYHLSKAKTFIRRRLKNHR